MSDSKIMLQLKTEDAERLFKFSRRFQNRSLFGVVRNKIGILMQHAKKKNIYAYIQLFKIKVELMNLCDELDEGIEKFEGAIKRFSGTIDEFRFVIKKKREFVFTNSLHHKLLDILKKFDHITCLILLTNRLDLFHTRKLFFSAKSKYKNLCLEVFGKIVDMKMRNLPEIQVEDYLYNTKAYQKAHEKFGPIDPQALFNAIHLVDLPFMDGDELERIEGALRRMMKLGRS